MLNVNVLAKSALAISAVLMGMFNATAFGNEAMLNQVMSMFKMVLIAIVAVTALINLPRILRAFG